MPLAAVAAARHPRSGRIISALVTVADPVQLQRVAELMLQYHELGQPFNVTRLTG